MARQNCQFCETAEVEIPILLPRFIQVPSRNRPTVLRLGQVGREWFHASEQIVCWRLSQSGVSTAVRIYGQAILV